MYYLQKKLEENYGKIAVEDEINETGEELNLSKIETNMVNNVIPKPEEFGEPFKRNTHFTRPRYIPTERITNFPFGFIQKKNYNLGKSWPYSNQPNGIHLKHRWSS